VRIRKGEGVLGRTAITHEPVQVPDITREGAYESRLRDTLVESGCGRCWRCRCSAKAT
jgi:hypothetical protein